MKKGKIVKSDGIELPNENVTRSTTAADPPPPTLKVKE